MTDVVAMRSLASALALAACTSSASATTYQVIASGMTFTPDSITIRRGDKITFTNVGGADNVHNLIADNGSFHCGVNCNTNSAPTDRPWSYTITFGTEGTVGYYCEQHGTPTTGMRGMVIVLDNVFFDGFDGPPPGAAQP